MKAASTVFLLALVIAGGCAKQQTVQIVDPTKAYVLTLTPEEGRNGSILSLSIKGQIDGTARIWFDDSSTNLVFRYSETNVLSGRIDIRYTYNPSSNCVVHYSPVGVRAGKVTIKYAFH